MEELNQDQELFKKEIVISSNISANDKLDKNYDYLSVSNTKQYRTDLKKEQSVSESSERCINIRKRKKKQNIQNRKNKCVDENEIQSVIEGMDDEIDNILEETAQKNKLTVPNVKSILRHVITNEYVLAMVRNTMKAEDNNVEDLEDIPFEPKLTRSKVKELKEKQHMLPWPVSTPSMQVEPETQALLEGEFSDESSSDEDYKPNEEECPSEEEVIEGSPKTGNSNSNPCELVESPASKSQEFLDEEPELVIAVPEPESELESTLLENEVDNIALRTRSKLPLNDTPLEAIEASLVAPDITVDMYDTNCDDKEWLQFLKDLSQPFDSFATVEKPDEEPDDPEEDPEYNALEDDDIPDELDFRFDNSMKITRKELNALMAEIYDYDESFFNDADEDEEQEIAEKLETSIKEDISVSKEVPDVEDLQMNQDVQTERSGWGMLPEERLQLEQQMRMYVQFLTQSYLLSYGIPELNYLNISSKLFLDELKMFASNSTSVNGQSAFNAYNLEGALDIVNDYENDRNKYRVRPNIFSSSKGSPGFPSYQVKKTLYESKVFIYPELLPTCGLKKSLESKKTTFIPAEDNLIALGLEQFSFSKSPVYYIQMFLVPVKTEAQIKIRIKNSKSTKSTLENPIKYFYFYKRAPSFPRTIEYFNPEEVKAPKDRSPETLPQWMRQAFPGVSPNIQPILPKAPKLYLSVPAVNQYPQKRKYRRLLPRKVHFSPLKHISPILKKYNHKRFLSINADQLDRKNKIVSFSKKCMIKPSLIPLKPDTASKKSVKVNIKENDLVHLSISNCSEQEKNTLSSTDNTQNSSADVYNNITHAENEISKSAECIAVDSGINDCDGTVEFEAIDEGDDENIDDEPETLDHHDSVMTHSSINKKLSVHKKKNKQQRDLESSLALLQPDLLKKDPKREERETLFVNSYLLRVTEALKEDSETCEKFLRALCKHQHSSISPIKLYLEIKEILKKYPGLANDFVAFLSPEQAKECGKYKEFVILKKIRTFIRKVEVHFMNQPQHLLKILRIFAQFRQQSSITSAEVLNVLQPLLKNQSHLIEELVSLLPEMAPPENLMTDFQEITLPNSDDDKSSVSSCEDIQIPDTPDPFGGKECPCECHALSTEAKVINKVRHCMKCGVKFMDGRVYIQTGKVLKPAQVVYYETPPEPAKNCNMKATVKDKELVTNANLKNPIVADQTNKLESSQAKQECVKSPVLVPPTVISSDELTVNKDPIKLSIENPSASLDETVACSSKLPYDVIEDTIFPVLPVAANKKNVPPDFSHLKHVIKSPKEDDKNLNSKSNSDNKTNAYNTEKANTLLKISNETAKWTKSEDRLIIYNCQRYGLTDKAFETSAFILKSKTPKEVQERFLHIMTLISKEENLQ